MDIIDAGNRTLGLLTLGLDPADLARYIRVDENGKVFLSDADVERIARKVVELLDSRYPDLLMGAP